jgi:hypothetical protein
MTLELNGNQSRDAWKVTPIVVAEAHRAKIAIEDAGKKLEHMTPRCPKHQNETGTFVELRGSYTRAKAAFRCPEGHDFLV